MDNRAVVDQDSELLSAYASTGDGQAFRRLVERHIDFVYTSAIRQAGDRQFAEDVAQAVFLLLAQKAKKIKPGTYVKGWLFNVTRFISRNAHRTEVRLKLREREAATMRCEIAPEQDQPLVSRQLHEALGDLGTNDRNALLMRYFDEAPMLAVGQAMGVSPQAAAKRISRALRRLRRFSAAAASKSPEMSWRVFREWSCWKKRPRI